MEIHETYFRGGPAEGLRGRLIDNPETWEVWKHRQAPGVFQIGEGSYGLGHQDEFWERLLYRRVDDYPSWLLTYVPAEWPPCLEHGGGPSEPVSGCSDPEHDHFWYPENWPGGRAPGRWRIRTPERDSIGVAMWVPTGGDVADYTYESVYGGAKDCVDDVRGLIRMEARLAAHRDQVIAERAELEEARVTGMAMPG